MDWKVLVGFQVLLLILLSTSASSDDGEKRIVCYYTNWSVYRPGTAKFSPQNINPYLCTHLIYAFGGFTKDNTLKPFDKYQDVDKGGYAKFTGLKTYNKNLKTLLAIGGWNEGSNRFSPMVADPQRRRQFVKSAVKFLRQNHFDGLDLDWEYPAFREGGKPRDKNNYANLVQELREEFERESSKTGRPRLLLTMAVPAGTEYIDKGYDVPKLDEYLDFINLLSYDYHSAYEPAVNHHSPLYPLEEDNEYNYDNELTIDYTIKHLIKSGASSEKIVVGIPTYGRSYTLFNDDANTLGSPADGPGIEGDATREKGYLAYYEICESITKDDWNVEKPNPKAMGPYAYKNNQWVGYDDEEIVRAKAKYVNEKKLGGIMFWSIDNDDFRGKCHGRPYPLIEAAKEALFEENEKLELDVRPNAISTKKRNRVSESSKSNSLSNNRKSTGASNRRNTISRSFTGKRSSTPSKSRNRSNSKTISEHKPEDESIDENVENNENAESTKSSHKSTRPRLLTNKNRFRTRLNINERDNLRKQTTDSTSTQKILSKKLTTPEPPTTPDPGSDFKCEDEGFFPHPRDCKKYFWCLDSGPSGLGIVANQFTCPSGLVFNKLADSCDYPRNVICPKNKPKSTTTTPRTLTIKEKPELSDEEEEKEEDDDEEYEDEEEGVRLSDDKSVEEEKPKKVITTSAKPLLYKTIHRSRPTTTTTKTTTTSSTPVPVSNSANLEDEISDEEQDPRVIKELINLIKKAGGIEHLEKQLALQEKTSIDGSNEGNEQVTPATISKSLYERVLNQQSGKNNLFGLPASRLVSSRKTDEFGEDEDEEQIEEKLINSKSNSKLKFVNGPGRSQFEGLDEVPEVKNLRRSNKPKYVTITRQSSSTISTKTDDELDEDNAEEEEEVEEEDNEDVASSEEKLISNVSEEKNLPAHRSTPGYVNIRRTRPTSTTESSRADNDIKELDTVTKEEKQSVRRTSLRPTEIIQKEATEENTTPKTKYISINRFRSTTITPQKEIEQTTIESTSEKPAITTENFNDGHVVKEKTITVSGESGRISITPFTTAAPSTARTLLDHMSSTLNSTSPYTEEKFISTHYATKQVTEMTTAFNPNTIEDSATESLLNIASTESSIRETIAAVSQPRPFGFPRRTRPTIALSTISDTTRSSLTGIESTPRSKVSTNSRNIARSTTKAPTTRTRLRTRNREKSISTVDDKYLNVKDEALQTNSELQEYSKDIEAVSNSRSSNSNRGSSRYKSQNTTHSYDTNFRKNTNDKDQSKTIEASSRRHRRPLVTTVSSDLPDSQPFRISTEQSVRSKSPNRASRIKLDQQTADTFDNKAQTIRNINLLMEPINPISTSLFYTTSKIKPEFTDITMKNIEDTTQTESTRFLIEVTETIPSETTENRIDRETFNLSESSSRTTIPSNSWNSYLTSFQNSEDEIKTTMFDTITEHTLKPSTASKRSETTLSIPNQRTRKILLQKRPSTTPTSIEQPTKKSRRRTIIRRLRPFQEDILNYNMPELLKNNTQNTNAKLINRTRFRNVNENNGIKNSNHSSLSYSGISRSSGQRYFIRKKLASRTDVDTSTSKVDRFDDATNKRKSLFDRYRSTSLSSTHQPDVITKYTVSENSDSIDYQNGLPFTVSKNSYRGRTYKTNDSDFEESKDVSKKNSAKLQTSDYRRSRTRFRNNDGDQKEFENFAYKNKITPRYFSKTTSSTESSIQETLIPTKKFDYFADAIKRGNQLQRTTPKINNDSSILVSTSKPSVTRLVTSIVESATTERQKISIKKKYSSLTSTTYIPKSTTVSSGLFQKQKGIKKNVLINEIPRGFSTERGIEWSTLPIESEFVDKKFTTESNEESSSTIEIESVLDEPILQHSVFKNITAHKTTSNFMTEIPKKISILNNSLHSKPENDAQNISFIKKSLPMNPLNQNDMIRIVKVPVRLVDDPGDDFFLLQIPKNKLNVSRFSSILKIEVLKTDERILNDVNMLRNVEDNNILNGSLMIEKLNLPTRYNTEITAQSVLNINTSKLHVKHDNNTSKNDVFLNNNEKNLFLKNNENSTTDFTFKFENLNSLNINKTDSSSPSSKENSTTNESDTLIKKLDTKKNESAIYNLQKVFIKHVRPFFNANSMTTNPALLQSSKNSTAKKRIHRQRVLIYRSSAKDQPTNKSSQRRWIMKKVVRKRLRPTRLKLTDDPKTNATVSTDDVIDSFIEVNSSRNPGLSLFQQPGDMSLPEGAYTTISSATLSPETRILGIMADQSGIPQNLELILAEPPATISSTTDSGRAAITTSNFRRKISTTISPRTTEETSSSTSSSKVISSERRRLGQKYDSDRIVTPNSYQIRARPYKPAVTDYDYYEDEEERFVGKPNGKLFITNRGIIKCLDQGSFPHPSSCKKFISCAKMVNGNVIGTEYTCPRKLSFDPIGGICNWSAGLGCND